MVFGCKIKGQIQKGTEEVMKRLFAKKLLLLLGMMLLFSLAGAGIVWFAGANAAAKETQEESGITIVTSFYPMYVAALNLADGIEGVDVVNLTENQNGCLHDYQLTTKDLRILETADIFIMNGAEMEHVMEETIQGYQDLAVITSSEGISLLTGFGHSHSHETDGEFEPKGDTQKENKQAEEETVNGHIWMDPERYRQQMRVIAQALEQIDPKHASQYNRNLERYDQELQELCTEVKELSVQLQETELVIFHEAFAYLAEALGLTVIYTLNLDEESALSAGEIAEVVDEIQLHEIQFLWTEEQVQDMAAAAVAGETGANVLVLSALTKEPQMTSSPKHAYLDGMRENLSKIRSIMLPETEEGEKK